MSGLFLRSMSGRNGQIIVPGLGAVVATIATWTLARPEDSDPGNPGAMSLRAVLSWSNKALLADEELHKKIVVPYNTTTTFEGKGAFTIIAENILMIKEAELCPVE